MKTFYSRIISVLIAVFLFSGTETTNAQEVNEEVNFITVSGVVKDKQNRKRLEYVTISIPGSTIGTITNADGEFSLKIKDSVQARRMQVSHLGYQNGEIGLTGTDMPDQTIWLTPHATMLDEIIVRAREPRDLVEAAIKKIPDNYDANHSMLTGFYRETAQKGKRYINISEAVIDINKSPYSEPVNRDRVQVYKGRKLLSQRSGDTLAVKLLGGPTLSVYLDIVKNPDILLDLEMLPYYSFRLEEPTSINDRQQYVISFSPQAILPYALYYGKLFIDKENLSFTRAEFFLDMNDSNKATQAILKKKPFGLKFKPTQVAFIINYQDRDGKTYLSYISNAVKFKCDWKRKLFSTNYTIFSEMVVTDYKTVPPNTYIPFKQSFKTSQSLSDNVSNFADDDFWGEYNIIEPTETLENAVNRLKKQKPEKQAGI